MMMTLSAPDIRQSPWSLDDAYRYCEKITFEHYENFPVASRFIPEEKRRHLCAIYAFARTADDFADEPGLTPAERIDRLNVWESHLEASYGGEPRGPVFAALAETARTADVPQELLKSLLKAFKQDVTVHRYDTFEDVLGYCSYSANPVGRLVLLLFGYRDETHTQLSDFICTALQLTNFWQDVTVDLDKDRVYLPLEDLRRFGVSETQLSSRSFTPEFRRLLEFQVKRTRDLFFRGKPLLTKVKSDLAFELKLTWFGGMRILRKIENAGYNVLRKRPKLTLFDKMLLMARSFFS